MTDNAMRLFCFGLGYSGRVLAERLCLEGWTITGTARTVEGVAAIAASGWNGVLFDGARASADVRGALETVTHALVSVPPDAAGDPVLRWHGAHIASAPRLAWIGYLSTVGVYGDHGGALVDETTPPAPASERGRR